MTWWGAVLNCFLSTSRELLSLMWKGQSHAMIISGFPEKKRESWGSSSSSSGRIIFVSNSPTRLLFPSRSPRIDRWRCCATMRGPCVIEARHKCLMRWPQHHQHHDHLPTESSTWSSSYPNNEAHYFSLEQTNPGEKKSLAFKRYPLSLVMVPSLLLLYLPKTNLEFEKRRKRRRRTEFMHSNSSQN